MTLSYNNPLVRWAYLFQRGVPNETTVKDFFWRALVKVPATLLGVATGLALLGLFVWKHPWAALWIPYVVLALASVIYFFIKVSQDGDVHMFGFLRESFKIYFE